VILRALEVEDATVLASWQTDAVFAAHAGWRVTSDPADGEQWWRASILDPDPLLLRLAVTGDAALVGFVDLYGARSDERELGLVIGPSSRWGRGLATSAAGAALAHGFVQLGLRRVWAEAVAANHASVRVLEKAGLSPAGRGRAEEFLGEPSHYELFEITQSAWVSTVRASEAGQAHDDA